MKLQANPQDTSCRRKERLLLFGITGKFFLSQRPRHVLQDECKEARSDSGCIAKEVGSGQWSERCGKVAELKESGGWRG